MHKKAMAGDVPAMRAYMAYVESVRPPRVMDEDEVLRSLSNDELAARLRSAASALAGDPVQGSRSALSSDASALDLSPS